MNGSTIGATSPLARTGGPALPVADRPPLRDRLYRRFFLAGIAAVLTVGAGWGAWLLLAIAADRSFTAPSIFAVNAHGQAQIYGWVGLFVLGFAYQAFPRFRRTELQLVPLAHASFFAMTAGIAVRSLTEPLAPSPWARIALAGAGLELAAVAMFVAVVAATFRRSEAPLTTSDRYILAAVGWFAAAGAFDLFHLAGTLSAGTREALLTQVANYQFALRDLQIHGLAMMMIFGVSLRYFPAVFATPAADDRLARRLWLPLNLAILGEVVGFVGFMRTRATAFAVVMGLATVALAVASVAYAANLRLFRRVAGGDRSLKFLRASHLWLALSMAMLVAAPLYFKIAGQPFSHAWYGAMRHAITVGFISLTIMGVAAKVVPTLAGVHTDRLSRLRAPFLLVNAGCTVRVVGQVATDFTAVAFPVAGVSGLLEVTGLAVWGVGLARVLLGRPALRPEVAPRPAPAPRRAEAELDFTATVSDWVRRYPATLAVFSRLGMDSCCGGAETVVNAARHNRVDLASLEQELAPHVG